MGKKFFKWLDEDLEESLLMILLIVISLVMMLQVIMRYCFRQSLPWPEEFCRYCFVYSGFLSIGYCIRRGKMLKVDILIGFLPKMLQRILDIAGRVVTMLFFLYLAYYALHATRNSMLGGMKSPALQVPMWLLYASVLLGSSLGVFRQIQDIIHLFYGNKSAGIKEKGDQ